MVGKDSEQLSVIEESRLRQIFGRGKVLDSDAVLLYNACEMVFRKHFSTNQNEKQDLIQEGIMEIHRRVMEGKYDGSRSALTYLYRGIRNVMHNFLYHEKKWDDKIYEPVESHDSGLREFEISDEETKLEHTEASDSNVIVEYVHRATEEMELGDVLAYYVKSYFYDKLGHHYRRRHVSMFDIEFVEKYRYYVNLVEFQVFVKFFNGKMFDSKCSDIIDVMQAQGMIDFATRSFLDTLNEYQLAHFLYVNSGQNINLPQKYKVLKIDSYLSIYRQVMGGATPEQVSRITGRPVSTVRSIVEKYTHIFKETNDEEE